MKVKWTDEQLKLLTELEFSFDVSGELDDDMIAGIYDDVSNYLMTHGIDEDDEVNSMGMICEQILDITADF